MSKVVIPPRQPASALRVFTDGLLLLLAQTGTVFSLTSLYELPRPAGFLLAACLVTGGLALAAFSLPRYRWAAVMGLALLYAAAVHWLWPEVRAGAALTAERAATLLEVDLPDGFSAVEALPDLTEYALSGRFLAAFLAVLSLPLGWSVVRGRSVVLTFLLTFSWLLPAMVVDRMPDWTPFLLLLGCWCLLLLASLCGRNDPNGGARFTLLCLLPVALLLGLITFFLPQEGYERPEWTGPARAYLEEKAGDFASAEGPFGKVTALLSGGSADVSVRLDDAGPRRFADQTVMRVHTDLPGRVYLRGTSSAVYTGSAWEPLDEAAYDGLDLGGYSPLNFPSLSDAGAPFHEMFIEYTSPRGGQMYTPYNLSTSPAEVSGVTFVGDACLERQFAVQTKNVYFRPISEMPRQPPNLPWEVAQAEAEYRRFVYDHYLDVPEDFSAVYYQWLNHFDPRVINAAMSGAVYYGYYGNAITMAQVFADLLNADTRYNLDTPFTPEDEDFVDYFLNESREGYCVHYASAGVLLLRQAGIPARYVTGYTVEIPASGRAEVKDSAAHAWVEIYLKGYGWYPVDMTPPSGTGIEPDALTTYGAQPVTPEEPEPEEPEEPEAPETPKPETLNQTPEEKPEKPESSMPDKPDKPGNEPEADAFDWSWAAWVLPLLGAAAILPVRRWACRRLRHRLFHGPDTNAAVVAAYGYLERLVHWGTDAEALLGELAQKARFSQHRLSEQERARALLAVTEERARLEQTLGRGQWWLLRNFWAL
ncbi:MAG: transglutaminase domain-containing protein [Oscillospiraceae bacterium]|nr:transglutaminase domain-containing protein [Oscillospiraceae bacterium]